MNQLQRVENDGSLEGIHLLSRTIESFNGAASRFETYYRHLERRVQELDLELKKKNVELSQNLNEKEEAQNYLRNILESLTSGVVVTDLNGNITTFNRAAEQITGLSSNGILGKNIETIFRSNLFPKLRIPLGLLKSTEQKINFETLLTPPNTNETLSVTLSMFPVENQKGEKIGTAVTIKDITQLKKLEEKANRTDKLSAMGEMAAEIAHEIRNPLGSIELFATTLKKDLAGMPDHQSLTDHISSGVRSLNNIISNLLLFVAPQKQYKFKKVDIHWVLNDTLIFLKHLLDSNPRLNIIPRFSKESLAVHGDSELLKQAFMNLVTNAVQAMPEGGTLNISTEKVQDDLESHRHCVVVKIRDTGPGIPEKVKTKIFDPFFTTKAKGTGLGLAIVHNILKLHNTDIDIENPQGGGTLCTLRFPFKEDMND